MEEPISTEFDPFAWPRQLADYDLEHNVTSAGDLRKPRLEGAPGFDRCWDAQESIMRQAFETTRAGASIDAIQGSVYSSFYMQVGMQMAHVLTIDPDQVAVLPEWDSTFDPIDYANNLRLPFERVFIDVEDGLGRSPDILSRDREGAYRIHGCLVEQPGQRGPVRVTPLGYYEKDKGDRQSKARYIPFGHMVVGAGGPKKHVSQGSIDMNIELGKSQTRAETVMYPGPDFKSPKPGAQATWVIDVSYLNHVVHDSPTPAPETFKWTDYPPERYADVMAREEPLPFDAYLHVIPPTENTQRDRDILAFATGVWAMMDRFMQILFFLDTPQVEIVEAPVSRQVRRQAERKGIAIARRIEVNHSSKRYPPRKEGDPDEANYSHRFEVRGHYKYFPEGTQMANARKDELRYVPGRGPCRKIWCPPFIKGSADKPFIPKTRHLRDQ